MSLDFKFFVVLKIINLLAFGVLELVPPCKPCRLPLGRCQSGHPREPQLELLTGSKKVLKTHMRKNNPNLIAEVIDV